MMVPIPLFYRSSTIIDGDHRFYWYATREAQPP